MSDQNVEEKQLTIKWLMQADKIIKFEEIDETYDISDPVAKFDYKKMGVDTGSKVNVKIDKNIGTHGTVVFMAKEKSNSSNSPIPASSSKGEIKTVKAYGDKFNGSLLFTDDDKTWYSCAKSIGVENLAQYKDKTVEVTTATGPKGGKYVNSIKIVGDQPVESTNDSQLT